MSIRKQYLKSKPACKVTFKLGNIPEDSAKISLVGEFNNWDEHNGHILKKSKDGQFSTTLELEPGREYEFKYLVNGMNWLNDPEADKYVPNTFQGENSVVVV